MVTGFRGMAGQVGGRLVGWCRRPGQWVETNRVGRTGRPSPMSVASPARWWLAAERGHSSEIWTEKEGKGDEAGERGVLAASDAGVAGGGARGWCRGRVLYP